MKARITFDDQEIEVLEQLGNLGMRDFFGCYWVSGLVRRSTYALAREIKATNFWPSKNLIQLVHNPDLAWRPLEPGAVMPMPLTQRTYQITLHPSHRGQVEAIAPGLQRMHGPRWLSTLMLHATMAVAGEMLRQRKILFLFDVRINPPHWGKIPAPPAIVHRAFLHWREHWGHAAN